MRMYLYVWRLNTEITVEELTAYVKEVCDSDVSVKIERINHKTERNYAFFIITESEAVYVKLSHPEV